MANNETTTSNMRTLLGDAEELNSRVEEIVRNNETTTSNMRTLLGDAEELNSRVEEIVRRL